MTTRMFPSWVLDAYRRVLRMEHLMETYYPYEHACAMHCKNIKHDKPYSDVYERAYRRLYHKYMALGALVAPEIDRLSDEAFEELDRQAKRRKKRR